MFGKTKDVPETDETTSVDLMIDDFFGDEAAVAEAVRIDNLHQRLSGVEQQINSQFTSMAAYAQIAQEQIELVRSEAQHANERSEQRVIGLIERERSDRMSMGGGDSATPNVTARLDALDVQVAEIRETIQQCLSNQKALADAITDLFAQPAAVSVPAPPPAPAPVAEPTIEHEPLLPVHGEPVDAIADVAPLAIADEPIEVMPIDAAIDDVTPIAPIDDSAEAIEDFGVFAAPDIATIEPMTSLPAPVIGEESFTDIDAPMPIEPVDGPIAALSLD